MHTSTKLDEILGRVLKPGRYAGGEYNITVKDPAAVRVHAAIAFPDVYEVGMSSLGFQIVHHFMNQREDTFCERVFAPWPDMERELRREGVALYTLETFTPLHKLDLVGFSLGSEATYTNVLTCLDLGGIPLRSAERTDSDPVVIAGGHCAFNPEPMAPFIDAFVVGEGEEVVGELLDVFGQMKGGKRQDILLALTGIEGVYVPAFYSWSHDCEGRLTGYTHDPRVPRTVRKRVVRDFEALDYPRAPVVPNIEAVHDRISVEVMRGCTRGCRFCQAGMITRPVRERSAPKISEMSAELLSATGFDEVSLVSLSTADYSGVECAVRGLIDDFGVQGVSVSLPSLRADAFSVKLASEIQKVRKSGLTFAPEAGTQRLRDVINKNISDEDIFSAAMSAWRQGWSRIKLYFMIGLPSETDCDVLGIAELVREIRRQAWQLDKVRLSISVSVASFVPKPFTPFQWRAQASPEQLAHKIAVLRAALKMPGVKLSWNEPRDSQLEGLLARGDRRVAEVILAAWTNGARFDAWREERSHTAWEQALAETAIAPQYYTNRQRDYNEPLPWDHIDAGVSKKYLMLEDQRALIEHKTPDCRREKCQRCGIFARLLPEHAGYGSCYHD
ncbi:MAG: TIGR03960 family B12-binding radical SAM protein [Armatimonadetes bacterium]|nr:TIGR03960 family B12-binding radical SAM protein [Armatimonadota bacterium]